MATYNPSSKSSGNLQPRECVDAATARLKTCKAIDAEVNEFFRERMAIEATYAKALEQLSRRALSVQNNQLGGFAEVWNKVLVSTAEEAQAHQSFAVGLSDKVVGPLGNFMDNDSEWRKARTYEVELGKHLKDYDDEVKKLKKDGKGAMGFLKNLKVKKSEEPSPEIAGAIEAANVVFNEKVTPVLLKFEQMDRSRKIALNNTLGRFCELFATVVKPASDIPDRILATTLGFDIETDKLFFASIMGLDSQPSGVGFDSPSSPRNGPSAQNTETGITATSAPLVDEEGFTIVPSQNPPAAWAATKQDDGFDSSDNEDAADTGAFDTAKMKVAISSSVIEDSNPSEAAGVLQNLAASLPNSNRKTNRISMIPSSYNAETTATNSTSYGAPAIPMPLPLSPQISSNTFNSVFGVPTPNASSAKQSIKLAANVVETVNVVIRDGMIEKLLVTGEISISLPFNAQSIPDAAKFKLAISGTDVFEQFVANSAFATPFTGPDGNGLDIELSKLVTHSSSGVVPVAKYQIRVADDDVDFYAPILANPIWKFDDASASLLLAFEYNDDLISRLTLGEVRILATLSDGGDLYNAQMKPEGAFSQERRSILWDIGSLGGQSEPSWPMPPGGSIRSNSSYGSSQGAAPLKVIARVETSSPASAGIVAIQFKANGGLLSGIDVDINDEVVMLNDVSKSVCSGKYVAYP